MKKSKKNLILKPWFPAFLRWRIEKRRERIKKKRTIFGLTMIELLITTTLVGTLSAGSVFVWRGQTAKAKDAARKDDLHTYQIIFEDYYNDNGCYPTIAEMADCGGESLQPYLQKVSCDPTTDDPYGYYPTADCTGYELYAQLDNDKDPDIEDLGCQNGCGPSGDYNYGIASGTTLTIQSAPVGGSEGGQYACDPQGQCNIYQDPSP